MSPLVSDILKARERQLQDQRAIEHLDFEPDLTQD